MKNIIKPTKSSDLSYSEPQKTLKFSTPSNGEFNNIGNQATNLSKAINLLSHHFDIKNTDNLNIVKLVVGYCSNIISTGLRDILINLLENTNNLHSIYTSCGGIEEDIIKIFFDTFLCEFEEDGTELRLNHFNRIGGVVLESKGYELMEDILIKYLDCLKKENKLDLTPTDLLKGLVPFLEKYIQENEIITDKFVQNNKQFKSILTLTFQKNIPYIPVGITDGAIGDIFTFYKDSSDFFLDLVKDYKDSIIKDKVDVLLIGDGNIKNRVLDSTKHIRNLIIFTSRPYYDGCDVEEVDFEAENIIVVYGDASINFSLFSNKILK